MMPENPDLLLIVARAPVPGTTKTRLAATIGPERSCALYRAFLGDLVDRFSPADGIAGIDVGWGFHPPNANFRGDLAAIADRPIPARVHFVPQSGETFNERLTNLFRWGFDAGYQRVGIMASDSPQLPLSTATDAFACLAESEIMLGRVADGGYYIVGLSRFSDILLDVPMSTGDAADAVKHRAADLGMRYGEITPSFDIDEERDLDVLQRALEPDGAAAPRTWAMLREIGEDGPHGPPVLGGVERSPHLEQR